MMIFPAPIDTPVTVKENPRAFSDTWNRYFKAISDTLLQTFAVLNAKETKSFKYVINGNLMHAVFYVETATTADIVISLPFPSLLAFNIGDIVYAPGTKSVVIPAGTTYLAFTAVMNTN